MANLNIKEKEKYSFRKQLRDKYVKIYGYDKKYILDTAINKIISSHKNNNKQSDIIKIDNEIKKVMQQHKRYKLSNNIYPKSLNKTKKEKEYCCETKKNNKNNLITTTNNIPKKVNNNEINYTKTKIKPKLDCKLSKELSNKLSNNKSNISKDKYRTANNFKRPSPKQVKYYEEPVFPKQELQFSDNYLKKIQLSNYTPTPPPQSKYKQQLDSQIILNKIIKENHKDKALFMYS